MADSGIDWTNHSFLREAIWGIYGGWSNSIVGEKWKRSYSAVKFPTELIDNRYMIEITADVTYHGSQYDHVDWSDTKHFEAYLPFIVGLAKSDFYDDCTMSYEDCSRETQVSLSNPSLGNGVSYWDVYAPSKDVIPGPAFLGAESAEIKNIRITLIRKNTTALNLTWVD
jgi:hypothetical protein